VVLGYHRDNPAPRAHPPSPSALLGRGLATPSLAIAATPAVRRTANARFRAHALANSAFSAQEAVAWVVSLAHRGRAPPAKCASPLQRPSLTRRGCRCAPPRSQACTTRSALRVRVGVQPPRFVTPESAPPSQPPGKRFHPDWQSVIRKTWHQ